MTLCAGLTAAQEHRLCSRSSSAREPLLLRPSKTSKGRLNCRQGLGAVLNPMLLLLIP
jgi:hypothetical protein